MIQEVLISLTPQMPVSKPDIDRLLSLMLEAEFDPQTCRNRFARFIDSQGLNPLYFRREGFQDGGLLTTEQLLFPRDKRWRLEWRIRSGHRFTQGIRSADVGMIAQGLRNLASARTSSEFARKSGGLRAYLPPWVPEGRSKPVRSSHVSSEPGIYRREHACLEIQSSTTRIVIDPIPLQASWTTHKPTSAYVASQKIDGVLITHSHSDHWHLPSLLSILADHPEVPVIVPKVKRRNWLCPTLFSEDLKLAGQSCWVAPWGKTLTIGDIEIDVLPFYGEQPCRDLELLPGLRNMGNCYRITTPTFSALILSDAGSEYGHKIQEPVAKSFADRGPVDVVLACARSFPSPFFGGLSEAWAALPFDDLRKLYRQFKQGSLGSVTATPQGIAEICKAAGARHYLPYAHGFQGVGRPIRDIGWGSKEGSEAQVLRAVGRELKKYGAKARPVSWKTGDFLSDRELT